VILKIWFLTFGDWKALQKFYQFIFQFWRMFWRKLANNTTNPGVGVVVGCRPSVAVSSLPSVFLAAAVAAAVVALFLLLLLLLLSFPSLRFSRLRVSPILISHDSAPPQNPSPPPPLH
jgi:hypothetical protein